MKQGPGMRRARKTPRPASGLLVLLLLAFLIPPAALAQPEGAEEAESDSTFAETVIRAIHPSYQTTYDIKRQTNELEWTLAREERRRVNVDPGYVSLGKVVLASTKDHAHRLYLGQGIYGEVTLTYQHGHFRPWPWTYPDYASDRYCTLFDEIRRHYRAQLREGC